ncbi:LacI family DNA-binding transcriptional regulator [Kutzneria sp. CA-103260]|uniref:LacI family DNA-binding transcriptional regulator n=1 Tax=Kutzneria sp. CA-103260 TaxID=2802641 RepID=UPI001BA608E3|nr:substrate-binding domain-containing protein [Kutzneria sp. CA-103260]QUQ65319.1 LacI family transcriptional regulator [Kutzneria sp. CA-103260]
MVRRQLAQLPDSPTLADVAREAGVSRQTVSNVLHAPHKVKPATQRRVEQAIVMLGYHPNRSAQALQSSSSRMIGYRIEPQSSGTLAGIHDRFLHSLAEAGRTADHHLLLYTAADRAAETDSAIRLFRSGAADAFVLYDITVDDPRPSALHEKGIPFVAFGHDDCDAGAYRWVDVDNVAGTSAAVDHLVSRGHRRIGFVGWPDGSAVGDRRARGWRSSVERHGLADFCHGLDLRGPDSVQAAIEMTAALLGRPEPPTAIVAGTDTLAAGVARAALRRGLEVGRDLAIVGFDDTPTAAVLELSSIRQPIEDVGRHVIAALLAPGSAPPRNTLLPPQLVIRSSSAGPPSR